jgi:hypothetical protein
MAETQAATTPVTAEEGAKEVARLGVVSYEGHITVKRTRPQEEFIEAVKTINAKPLLYKLFTNHINEEKYLHWQTSKHYVSTAPDVAYAALVADACKLSMAGWTIKRIKLEGKASGGPYCEAMWRECNRRNKWSDCYYEFHFALLTKEDNRSALEFIAAAHNGAISQNLLRARYEERGLERFFATFRYYKPASYKDSLDRLYNFLHSCSLSGFDFAVEKQHDEFCYYDTNPSYDGLWLDNLGYC